MDIERAKACTLLFGKHKDKRLDEVPRSYLVWIHENGISKSEYLTEAINAVLAMEPAQEEKAAPEDLEAPF